MGKTKRWLALLLCGALALGGVAWQLVPAVAESECTCEIEVHGSNCPLSRCICDGVHTGEHTEDCALYGLNSDLTVCVCQPDIHAEGCPRYEGNGELMDSVSTAEENDTIQTPAGNGSQEQETQIDGSDPELEVTPDTEDSDGSQTETEQGQDGNMEGDPDTEIPEETEPEPSQPDTEDGTDVTDTEEPSDTDAEEPTETDPLPDGEDETEEDMTEEGEELPKEEPAEDPDEEPMDVEVPDDLDAMEEDWEYPSGWSGYGEGQMRGNVLAAAQAFELDAQLVDHVVTVQGYLTNGNNARLSEDADNFGDILAVYAVLSGQTEDYPYGVTLEEGDVELLHSVYWSMTQVTGLSNASGAAISVRRLSAAEGAELYNLTAEQKTEVLSLAGRSDVVDAVVRESIFASLTAEEFENVLALVPDNISAERRAVLLAAVSLDGKVGYFWGGKSLAYGWDDRWGEMRTVASEGSDTYGTARPLGLDCSGFVSWAFINAYGVDNFSDSGTSMQWSDTVSVAWSDAQPGDLVFYYEPGSGQTNHVGIILTVDGNGPETVVHCSGSKGVIISGPEGFSYVRRPVIYS